MKVVFTTFISFLIVLSCVGRVFSPQSSPFRYFHVFERFINCKVNKGNKVSFKQKHRQFFAVIGQLNNRRLVNPPIFCRLTVHFFTEQQRSRAQRRRASVSYRKTMAVRLIFWLIMSEFLLPFSCANVLDRLNVTRVKSTAYDELFADGVRAYSDEKWSEAVELFEKAIADYKHEKEVKLHCRLRCRDRYKASSSHNVISDLELNYYRYTIYSHKCAQKCREKYLGKRSKVSAAVRRDFELRVPYGYLQFAYYKVS